MTSALIAFGVVMSACSSGETASDTTRSPDGLLACKSESGTTFNTALDSCEKAIKDGSQLVADVGLATSVDTPAADSTFSQTCAILQGGAQKSYTASETLTLATQLNETGICPGNLKMLIRSDG